MHALVETFLQPATSLPPKPLASWYISIKGSVWWEKNTPSFCRWNQQFCFLKMLTFSFTREKRERISVFHLLPYSLQAHTKQARVRLKPGTPSWLAVLESLSAWAHLPGCTGWKLDQTQAMKDYQGILPHSKSYQFQSHLFMIFAKNEENSGCQNIFLFCKDIIM